LRHRKDIDHFDRVIINYLANQQAHYFEGDACSSVLSKGDEEKFKNLLSAS
jgi:hypothetical protein